MKAIETRYAGCHFRSRLEARWAVFFDTLGIAWEYEAEGFELSDGQMYLPDFRLPDLRIWVEVKPKISPDDVKWHRLHLDVNQNDNWEWIKVGDVCGPAPTPTALLAGWPWRTIQVGQIPRPNAGLPSPWRDDIPPGPERGYGLAIGPGSPHSGWSFTTCLKHQRWDLFHVAFGGFMQCGCTALAQFREHPKVVAALAAARSARFEHGQSGAT